MHRFDRARVPGRGHFAAGLGDAAHHFGGVDGGVIFAAGIDAFRREGQEPVLAHRQVMFGAEFRQKDFARRARVRGGLQHNDHALAHVFRQLLRGGLDERHVGVAGFAERRRHTDADRVHIFQHGKIRRGFQVTGLDEFRNRLGRNVGDIRHALFERLDLARVRVHAGDFESGLAEHHGQRQTHIAESEDGDLGGLVLQFLDEGSFGGHGVPLRLLIGVLVKTTGAKKKRFCGPGSIVMLFPAAQKQSQEFALFFE